MEPSLRRLFGGLLTTAAALAWSCTAPDPAPAVRLSGSSPIQSAYDPVLAPLPTPLPGPPGLLVPLYSEPSSTAWSKLVTIANAHRGLTLMAIVNPANGVTLARDPAYEKGIARLARAGVTVLGYVSTKYGKRSPATVRQELDRWRAQYPLVSGVFFDEMAGEASTYAYYAGASTDANKRGFTLTVGNAGTAPDARLAATMDIVVVYEEPGLPKEPPPPTMLRDRLAMLALGVSRLDEATVVDLAKRYRYLYVTEDGEPNPWDSVSRFTDAMATTLMALP